MGIAPLHPSYAAWSQRAFDFLKRARRRIDDRTDIRIRHRGRQCLWRPQSRVLVPAGRGLRASRGVT